MYGTNVVPLRYGSSAAVTAAKRVSICDASAAFFAREQRLHRVERGLRSLHVRFEVDEVGARVALLLTGDLRARHLVQQLHRAVGDAGRLQLHVLHEVRELLDVLVELLR